MILGELALKVLAYNVIFDLSAVVIMGFNKF